MRNHGDCVVWLNVEFGRKLRGSPSRLEGRNVPVDDGDSWVLYMGGQAKKGLPWVTSRIFFFSFFLILKEYFWVCNNL